MMKQPGYNPNSNTSKEMLKRMFKMISSILQEAIERISLIYNENSIRFQIRHQLDTVMRILVPFELRAVIDES